MAVERHINFFELQKACAEPSCPLCRIIAARAERYIDNMLFEHVSDRGFRAHYRAAGGFCAFHARNLESFRDGLAVAILGRDTLEDRLASLKRRGIWKAQRRCPVCEEQERIEGEYLTFLIEAGSGEHAEELREFFTASDGLCIPHYEKLLEYARHGHGIFPRGRTIPRWLIAFHESRFEELLRRTGQFIEFSAYGRQAEFAGLSEADKLVWKELALTLRGG
ncbi:MAG: hypothetical protein LBG76_02455 [Treponema sp.]|jgi:hypothetical protein|nr:hypothetical protein [Treponema sp.]